MYTGVGQDDSVIFLPGSLPPRRGDNWRVTLKPPTNKLVGAACAASSECASGICTAGICRPMLKSPAAPRESTPAPIPSLIVSDEPTTEPGRESGSMLPIYIAAGGVAVIGAIWFFTRK